MRKLALLAGLALSSSAFAQSPPAEIAEYAPLIRQQRDQVSQQLLDAMAEIAVLRTHLAAREKQWADYLKACGDKPGCTVPAE